MSGPESTPSPFDAVVARILEGGAALPSCHVKVTGPRSPRAGNWYLQRTQGGALSACASGPSASIDVG